MGLFFLHNMNTELWTSAWFHCFLSELAVRRGNVCFFLSLMFDCKMKKGSSTIISSLCHVCIWIIWQILVQFVVTRIIRLVLNQLNTILLLINRQQIIWLSALHFPQCTWTIFQPPHLCMSKFVFMFLCFDIILFHWPHLKFIFNFSVRAPLFTWGQFVLDETERDERGAKPEAKGVPEKPPKKRLNYIDTPPPSWPPSDGEHLHFNRFGFLLPPLLAPCLSRSLSLLDWTFLLQKQFSIIICNATPQCGMQMLLKLAAQPGNYWQSTDAGGPPSE